MYVCMCISICVCTCGGESFVAVGAEQCVGVPLLVYARPGLVAQVRAHTHISIYLSIYLCMYMWWRGLCGGWRRAVCGCDASRLCSARASGTGICMHPYVYSMYIYIYLSIYLCMYMWRRSICGCWRRAVCGCAAACLRPAGASGTGESIYPYFYMSIYLSIYLCTYGLTLTLTLTRVTKLRRLGGAQVRNRTSRKVGP